jgi:hypothetical protein
MLETEDLASVDFIPQGANKDARRYAMRRIVACVNALSGVPTDWLENYTAGNVENVIQENARLTLQRDELLAALKDLFAQGCGMPKSCGHTFFCICPGDNASEIIQKVEANI